MQLETERGQIRRAVQTSKKVVELNLNNNQGYRKVAVMNEETTTREMINKNLGRFVSVQTCIECGERTWDCISFNPDGDSPSTICLNCLKKAVALLETKENRNDHYDEKKLKERIQKLETRLENAIDIADKLNCFREGTISYENAQRDLANLQYDIEKDNNDSP